MKTIIYRFNIIIIALLFIFVSFGCNPNLEDKEYTVNFYLSESELYKAIKVKEGTLLAKPTDLIIDNVEVVWMMDKDLICEYDFSLPVNEDLNLYAKYIELLATYKVSFKDNEEIIEEVSIKEGQKIGDLTIPTVSKDGYTFKGWEYNGSLISEEFIPTGDITLSAKWEYIFTEDYIDLDFYIDGEYYKSLSYEAGEVINHLTFFKASKYGYKFIGWFMGDIEIYDGYMPLKSGRVDAKFEPLGTIYKLTIDGETTEYLENDPVTLPTKVIGGKTLIGYADEDGYVINGEITMTKDYILTSVWKDNLTSESELKINFKDKEIIKVPYGSSVIMPSSYKYGYSFLGWTDGKYKYSKGFNFTVVNNETFRPIYKQFEGGTDDTNIDYTISSLDLFYESLTFPLTSDVTLPTYDDLTATTITWTSGNNSIMTNDGKITRIMHEDRNIEVVMTANVVSGDASATVDYTFTVKQIYKSLDDGIAAGYMYPSSGISDYALDTLDIIYGAFLNIDSQGNIASGEAYANSVSSFLSRAHAKGVRVLPSVGALNATQIGYFKTISESPSLTDKLASNLLKYVIDNKFDGIDMDWETPGTSHATYYTKLMKVIYEKFKAYDKELLVTAAIGAGPWQYKYFDLSNSAKYHDYINMMSYDLQSSAFSSYQNALYSSSKNYLLTSQCCIVETIKLYNSVNIPNEKIIIGMPFYGREFINSTGVGSTSKHNRAITQEVISNYIAKYGSSIVHWDDECKVSYLYIPSEGIFVTYESEQSIHEKMKYVGENGLAGIMYWQNGQDYNDKLITAINKNYSYLRKD